MTTNLPILIAITFLRRIESGVSKPLLLNCYNENLVSEYAVKLKTKVNDGIVSLCSELIASKLANILDIDTPEIAVVNLSEEFANSVEDSDVKNEILSNLGLNFGSKIITGNTTWIQGQTITNNILKPAFEIFAYDALIQNPDRTLQKPNFLIYKDSICIIDHEKGFSFVRDLFNRYSPWEVSKLSFLRSHIFYPELKRNKSNLAEYFDSLENKIKRIKEEEIDELFFDIPDEWNNEHLDKIKNHLTEVIKNSDKFIYELKILLA